MKCPNCKKEMEKGMLAANGFHWIKEKSFVGKVNKMVNYTTDFKVWAYRCPHCKKIEFTSE